MNILIINLMLILLIVIYYLNFRSKGTLNHLLELDSKRIRNKKEYYRLLTFGFCHGNLFHLIVNILVIRNILAPFFQDKLSTIEFLLLFIFSAMLTGGIQLLFYRKDEFTFVGSSVGFYSFFGLMAVYYSQQGWQKFISDLNQQPFFNNLLIWAILAFVLGNIVTSYWEDFKHFSGLFAHSISFLIGIVVGSFL